MTDNNHRPVARIAGTGHASGTRVLTNFDLERMVDTSDEWITARTGIKERHLVENGTVTSDLCSDAAKQALADAGLSAENLDYIIVGTVTGDMKFPSTASILQSKLGAYNASTFDISAACSGFIYGLDIADSLIRSGRAETILVIGAEVLSSMTNYQDRKTCVLFGDGAGAAVVTRSDDDRGILSTHTGSNGDLAHLLYCDGGGSLKPAMNRDLPFEDFTLRMNGNEVFKHAVRIMDHAALTALEKAGISPSDVDMFIPHQANIRIIDAMAKRLSFSRDRIMINIDRYGNTSTASIPTALNEARLAGRVREGDVVLVAAFGGGFTWASAVFRM
ncbi:MAG: 3-oxoacyl-[acyl-carrier-protein] synthase 3 [Calditrichaeota bacterium]|nr:3-oxoacyl-[acyl-carrier-protein] synthase 3 [Calditrichota bacterium]